MPNVCFCCERFNGSERSQQRAIVLPCRRHTALLGNDLVQPRERAAWLDGERRLGDTQGLEDLLKEHLSGMHPRTATVDTNEKVLGGDVGERLITSSLITAIV
ncbi:MAG: hypothetical protein ACT4OZ_15150 [Gemmatimonadota bacterium]